MYIKNKFEIVEDEIHISHPHWTQTVLTSYRDDYYKELTSHQWRLNNGYPYNQALGGTLHKYIMKKWYGEKTYNDFLANGFVVDHLNNNHCDCRISNLEFLLKRYNTAKGQSFDIDADRLKPQLALNIFKDFTTSYYQITIGCNTPLVFVEHNINRFFVSAIKFLYNCDYPIVLNDAENILLTFERQQGFDFNKLNALEIKLKRAPIISDLTEDEKNATFVMRNGQYFLNLSNGTAYIDAVNFDKGWKPNS